MLSTIKEPTASPSVSSKVWLNQRLLGLICEVAETDTLSRVVSVSRYSFDIAVKLLWGRNPSCHDGYTDAVGEWYPSAEAFSLPLRRLEDCLTAVRCPVSLAAYG